ncbi:MAG: hypothetical protein KDB07_03445, partial [Planctomycetes bacterium]|nr:hypothetical protein [Planctomycetota bacterium]
MSFNHQRGALGEAPILVAILAFVLFGATALGAATYTRNGTSNSNGSWNNANNWTAAGVPNDGDTAVINGGSGATRIGTDAITGLLIGADVGTSGGAGVALDFQAGANQTFTFGAAIAANPAAYITSMSFAAGTAVSLVDGGLTGVGSMYIKNAFSTANACTINVGSNTVLVFQGNATLTNVTLNIDAGAEVRFQRSVHFTGCTLTNNGTMYFEPSTPSNLNTGGLASLGSVSFQAANPILVNGNFNSTELYSNTNSSTVTFNGPVVVSGNIQILATGSDLLFASSFTQSSGTFANQVGRTVQVAGNLDLSGISSFVNSGLFRMNNAGSVNVAVRAASQQGTWEFAGTGTTNITNQFSTSSALTFEANSTTQFQYTGGTTTWSGATVTLNSGATAHYYGDTVVANGSFTASSGSTIIIGTTGASADFAMTGSTTVTIDADPTNPVIYRSPTGTPAAQFSHAVFANNGATSISGVRIIDLGANGAAANTPAWGWYSPGTITRLDNIEFVSTGTCGSALGFHLTSTMPAEMYGFKFNVSATTNVNALLGVGSTTIFPAGDGGSLWGEANDGGNGEASIEFAGRVVTTSPSANNPSVAAATS